MEINRLAAITLKLNSDFFTRLEIRDRINY